MGEASRRATDLEPIALDILAAATTGALELVWDEASFSPRRLSQPPSPSVPTRTSGSSPARAAYLDASAAWFTEAMTLRPTDAVERGDWIRERLGAWSAISSVMPRGFEAYARVFHPIDAQLIGWDVDGRARSTETEAETSTWAEFAARRGKVAHPLMQWNVLADGHVNPADSGDDGWQYSDPQTGSLPLAGLAVIARILARHTAEPAMCTAGLWEGYAWVHGGGATIYLTDSTDPVEIAELDRLSRIPTAPALSFETRSNPRLELPGRAYLLFDCDIRDFEDPAWQADADWDTSASPNQLWPADRAWFLASEIDFDSTLIGGSRELINALLAAEGLEVSEIPADASLQSDADAVNSRPAPD